jgi:single-strand DNA-binding protein
MGMNKCTLHGHVGKDPELKKTSANKSFCRFSLATTETWKDQSGEKKSKTEWHQIVAWGKQAESIVKFVKKGQEIIVNGKIEYQTVEDKNDSSKKVTFTSIKLIDFDFCGKKDGNSGGGSYPEPEESGYTGSGALDSGAGDFSVDDEDIPF